MNPEPVTISQVAGLITAIGLIQGIITTVVVVLSAKRAGHSDALEDGARREQLRSLLALATSNEERWKEHDTFVDKRMEDLRETQGALARLTDAHARTAQDASSALMAAREASQAISRLAEGLAVQVRFGGQEITHRQGPS